MRSISASVSASVKKSALGLILALSLLMSMIVGVSADGSNYRSSGLKSVPKLSQEEIVNLLRSTKFSDDTDIIYDETPSLSAPFIAGKLSDITIKNVVNRTNALRRIAGVGDIQNNAEWSKYSQYASVVSAIDYQGHDIKRKPAGMSDSFFELAKEGARTSNMYSTGKLFDAIDKFFYDTGDKNMDSQGHRRWMMDPYLPVMGFGYSGMGDWRCATAIRVVGDNPEINYNKELDYDFLAWPSSGNFPASCANRYPHASSTFCWSVTVNPARYADPVAKNIRVKLTRLSDNKTWEFSGDKTYSKSASGEYFHVSDSWYGGAGNCIVFRPADTETYSGSYEVEISGLKTKSGAAVNDFRYRVDFFDDENYGKEPEPIFSDVSTDVWYYKAIERVVNAGLMNGVGNNKFDPDSTVTRAQMVTMFYRFDGSKGHVNRAPFDDVPMGTWYTESVAWAQYMNLVNGVGNNKFDPHSPITLEQMMAVFYRYINDGSLPAESSGGNWADAGMAFADKIGLTKGLHRGPLTRSDAAVLLSRFMELAGQ